MEKIKQVIEQELNKLKPEERIKIELKMELTITRPQEEVCDRVPNTIYEDGECDGSGPKVQ